MLVTADVARLNPTALKFPQDASFFTSSIPKGII
jgi:hypothetical protein